MLMPMSKRLQVILDDHEMKGNPQHCTPEAHDCRGWVRRALRAAKSEEPCANPHRKLRVLQAATAHSFPTADIEELLDQTEQGHSDGLA